MAAKRPAEMLKFTRQQVAARNHKDDLAVIIDNVVYDLTRFLFEHAGGTEILLANAGKDASEAFHEVGHSQIAIKWRQDFVVGEVVDEDRWELRKREVTPPRAPRVPHVQRNADALLTAWCLPLAVAGIAVVLYFSLFQ